jgi:hypothetical protein
MGGAAPFFYWLSVWDYVSQAVATAWPPLWAFLQSNFVTALVGSAAGAFGGALAAQRIAERNAALEAALTYVRNANSATTFAVGVANALTGLKRQFVVPLARDFKALVDRHEAHRVLAASNAAMPPFHFNPDMKFITAPATPINELGDVLRATAGDDPAAWMIFQMLRSILSTLDQMLAQRNAVLEEMRTLPPARRLDAVALYLGTPRADGNTDGRHVEIMKELLRVVDDALGFSRVLAEHIAERATKSANQFGRKAPKVRPADFSRADALGVFPDMKEFRDELARIRGEKVDPPAVAAQPPATKVPEAPGAGADQ